MYSRFRSSRRASARSDSCRPRTDAFHVEPPLIGADHREDLIHPALAAQLDGAGQLGQVLLDERAQAAQARQLIGLLGQGAFQLGQGRREPPPGLGVGLEVGRLAGDDVAPLAALGVGQGAHQALHAEQGLGVAPALLDQVVRISQGVHGGGPKHNHNQSRRQHGQDVPGQGARLTPKLSFGSSSTHRSLSTRAARKRTLCAPGESSGTPR